VYSQKQASTITTMSGHCFLIERIAFCTTPVSFQASLPTASLCSGMPNSSTAGMPRSCARAAASVALSTDRLDWPGIDEIGLSTPVPGTQNSG